jgi:amino acid adenylation domain-containing protein
MPAGSIDCLEAPDGAAGADTLAYVNAVGRLPMSSTAPGLSFAQERLWIIDRLAEDKALYNAAMIFDLRGALDTTLLEQAIAEVIGRHHVLRTGFVDRQGQAALIQASPEAFALGIEDLRGREHAAEVARRHQRSVLDQPFDLAAPPLLRAILYRFDDEVHQLVLTVHHIIFDGASIDIFLRELEAIYPSLTLGQAVSLPDLPLQSHDAAAIERQRISGEHRQRLADFWSNEFGGELPVLALPSDRPRPAVQTYRGATLSMPVAGAWMQQLEHASRRERVTPFMYMLATYALWLCRYAGQQDVVIGSPFALRADKDTRNLIGFLVNTVAMRLRMASRVSFRQFLHGVRDVCLKHYSYGEFPFGELVGMLGAQRELAHSPVFQAMLVVQNARPSVQLSPELRMSYAGEVPTDRARFDLALVLDPLESGATLSLEYNSDLFDASTAQRMLDHFNVLLSAAMDRPDALTDELPLLGDADRARAMDAWNDTGSQPAMGLAHELFEAQARRQPDAIALISGQTTWTYGELNRRADQLAQLLRRQGIHPETPVGVLLERSPELVCSMLAIFKAGGVYLPLDPAYPDERVAFMIGDARPGLVITGQGLRDRVNALLARQTFTRAPFIWDWHDDGATLEHQASDAPPQAPTPHELAYIIYTSGSTGKPKGVEVSHGAFFNLVKAKIDGFGVRPDSCVLQFVSFGFDVSVSDVGMTLAAGARLLLRPADIIGGEPLARLLREHEVSVIVLPASVLATVPADDLPALQSVIAGGEACSAELVDRWAPGRRFINAYGPTEATICTTMARCTPNSGTPPIGRPIPHARVYVLDTHLEPVPPGVTGELYIGGAGLARGYLGRPDLTAERFIPDPFAALNHAASAGARLYRTGDHARYLPDGSIAFVERVDDQVKIRGFRIELGEIEAVLRQHPSAQDAVVTAQSLGAGGKCLVGYVVPKNGEATDAQALITHLRARLPEHMVPVAMVPLAIFPRTTNGKIDRRALPLPEALGYGTGRAYVAPRTLTEEILATVIGNVLGLAEVSVEDDFFALGGQSILAAQVMARASERFELSLSLRLLFESPTIAALALRIEEALMEEIEAMDDADVAQALDTNDGAALAHASTGKGSAA